MTVRRHSADDNRTDAAADPGAIRRYDSPRRRERAEATRTAIAAAARQLFADRGWSGTTVRDVAATAGISEPTVFAAYGSKNGLARALIDAVTSSADTDRQGAELDAAQGDPAGQLAVMIGFDRRLYERDGDVLGALRDAGRANRELTRAYADRRAAADQLRHSVLGAWPRSALRVDRDEAVDIYAALCNIDIYRVLTGERGWSPDRAERWLHQTLCRLLLT